MSKETEAAIERTFAEQIAENRRSMVQVTMSLVRARAIKVALKGAGEELDHTLTSLVGQGLADKDKVEALVKEILRKEESPSTPQ